MAVQVHTRIPDVGEFKYTATNILGDKRNVMLGNHLHLRPKLGKSKDYGYARMPGESFVYGYPYPNKDDSVADAYRGWFGKVPRSAKDNKNRSVETTRDFVALNRAAIQEGLHTAADQQRFRAIHDIRKSDSDNTAEIKTSCPKTFPKDQVFGMPTRPSTPIHTVLENRFQDEWISSRYKELHSCNNQTLRVKRGGNIMDTRASLLRMHQPPVEKGPLWQMPRFSKSAKSKLQTFSRDSIKAKSLDADTYDKVPRQGQRFQHGIREPAKS